LRVCKGEFNSGKSSIINALLGHNLLDTGAVPTTDAITIITHSNNTLTSNLTGGLVWHQVPSMPEDIVLVDTPGTNAVIVDHTARTLKLLPTADLILFITSADRPFPDSERKLLQSIQAYRKNIVILINKMDVLDDSGGIYGKEEKQRVYEFVSDNASTLLGGRPFVIPVSSRDALAAKKMSNKALWERSNFQQLESFLKDSLTTETKIKAKLLNPIGVAEGVLLEGLQILRKEETDLETDVATLNLLNQQFDSWTREMELHLKSFCSDFGSEVAMEGSRMKNLHDRYGAFVVMKWSIYDPNKLENELQRALPRKSAQDLEADLLENYVQDITHSISSRAQAQWQAVVDYLGKQPSIRNKSIVGHITSASQFDDTRVHLSKKLQDAVLRILRTCDGNAKMQVLITSMTRKVLTSAVLEASAFVVMLATYLEWVDLLYGGTFTGAAAALGGLTAVQATSGTSQEYSKAWQSLGKELQEAFEAECVKELRSVTRKIRDGFTPYSRFVGTGLNRIQNLTNQSEDALSEAHAIRGRISRLRRYD
jgi:GTP-binding protein EngB required for normal cell division